MKAAGVVAGAYRIAWRSLRVDMRAPDGSPRDPRTHPLADALFAVREGDLLALAGLAGLGRFTALIAPGRDGDRATAVAEALGCRIVRGSSRHDGAAALVALVRSLRGTHDPLVLVVDGPLGPAGEAKAGVVAIASWLRREVQPVAAAVWPRVVVPGTWSRMLLPLPGARVALALGDPLAVPARPSSAQAEELRGEVTRRLARAAERASEFIASPPRVAVARAAPEAR